VFYKLEPGMTGDLLKIKVVEKSEQLFRFGLRYDSSTEASVLMNGLFRNAAMANAVLNLDLKLGQQIYFDAQYFFHTGLRPRIGFRGRWHFDDDYLDLFSGNRRIASLQIRSIFAEALFGSIFSNSITLGIGVRFENSDRSFRIGPVDSPSETETNLPLFLQIWVDTQDRGMFPGRGVSMFFRHEFAYHRLISDHTFSRHYFDFKFVLPVHRKISVLSEILLASTYGDSLPANGQFVLGGLNTPVLMLEKDLTRLSFVGLKPQELLGEHLQFYQLGLQYEVLARIFLQFRANIGNSFKSQRLDFSSGRFLYGIGLTIGAATPVGPVEFSIMNGSRHELLTHLNIGYKF